MNRRHLLLSLPLALLAASAPAADQAQPTVVELFQSQGCSSCPPATANLNAIAGRPDVLALSFAVTYWDQLGWKDTFAKPAFTQRQWDYARAGGRRNVATPQMIVNGSQVLNGGNRQQVDQVLARARRSGPRLAVTGGRLSIGAGTAASPATVWLVRYDPRTIPVAIRAGENGGRTLPHRDVVRSLAAIGRWTGSPATVALPAIPADGLRSAVFVQEGKGGPIVAATRL